MRIESIAAAPLSIPFKIAFRHASAERAAMQSLWVAVRSGGHVGHGEGCPREYVSGESPATALRFVERHRHEWIAGIADMDSLGRHVRGAREAIDANPAAWCAVELALLDLLGQAGGLAVERLINVPSLGAPLRYSAVLGDAAPAAFEAQLAHYVRAGFSDFKIKLSGDLSRDAGKVSLLRAAGIAPALVRADANNCFARAEDAIEHLKTLRFAFCAIEEPLRAGDYGGMRTIARKLGTPIILDESVLRVRQLDAISRDPERWIVNLRVSKMGGLLRSVELAREAARRGVRLIVGAHVGETSVLTRAAISVANLARGFLVAQEGAFGTHLLERDVADPSIMFAAGGMLDISHFGRPGFGLAIDPGMVVP